MKKILMYTHVLKTVFLLACIVGATTVFVSCSDDSGGAPPVLERVSLVPKDSTTLSGGRGETFVIFGSNLATTQTVLFNGAVAPLNTTMVRDDNIIIAVPDNAPFTGNNQTVKVVTKFGEAELPFEIEQPLPSITGFSPAVAAEGEIVTITGEYFENLISVKFNDVAAEIVSATGEEIQVKVPAGVTAAFINVTNKSGTTQSSSSFGFKFLIYDDDLAAGWDKWGWGGTDDWTNTQQVKRGAAAAKHGFDGGWSGMQVHKGDFALAGYTAIKISIYGGPGTTGKSVQLYIKDGDGDTGTPFSMDIVEGEWTTFTIPLTALGSPSLIDEMVIQDKGGAPYIIWVDDLGLI